MWHYNKKINATFVHQKSQWAWADIEGIGWKRIKEGATDSMTNVLALLSTARTHEHLVHIHLDANDTIVTACLLE